MNETTDQQHIQRLRALREAGTHNMFTDLRRGLIDTYGEPDGTATYEWVVANFEYFQSGEWRNDN